MECPLDTIKLVLFILNTGFLYKPSEFIHVELEVEVEVELEVEVALRDVDKLFNKNYVNFFLGERFFG
jgi:hypothetical protein